MAKLKGIYLTQLELHNGTGWRSVSLSDGTAPMSMLDAYIVLFRASDDGTTAPASMSCDINFTKLRWMGNQGQEKADLTAIHELEGGILPSQKSPIVRYKVVIGTWTSEEIFTVNQQWHYMMLNASFPSDPYSGAGSTPSTSESSKTVSLKLYFPAFTSTHIDGATLTLLQSLVKNTSNWSITCVAPGGATQKVTPTAVGAGAPTSVAASDYGLAKMLVTITAALSFPSSGSYVISATFQSNDNDQAALIPGSHTVMATIFVNSGSLQPFICSFDADATLIVSISQ